MVKLKDFLILKSKEPHIFGFVNAIIDTGSPTTILGGADLQKMRISQIQMQKLVDFLLKTKYILKLLIREAA